MLVYLPVELNLGQIFERAHNHQVKYSLVYSPDTQFHLNEDDRDQVRFQQRKILLLILKWRRQRIINNIIIIKIIIINN